MIKQIIEAYTDEIFLKADGFDRAVIGVDESRMVLIYSVKKCIKILVKRDKMEWNEAVEFFDFNISGSLMGEKTPVWCVDI